MSLFAKLAALRSQQATGTTDESTAMAPAAVVAGSMAVGVGEDGNESSGSAESFEVVARQEEGRRDDSPLLVEPSPSAASSVVSLAPAAAVQSSEVVLETGSSA